MKLFIAEDGTSEMLSFMASEQDIVVSGVTKLEATSAFLRRQAMGQLAAGEVAGILDRLEHACAIFDTVPLSDAVLSLATNVLQQHRLRTLDAIQLASAEYRQRSSPLRSLLFVAADQRLLSAAAGAGLQTWNPVSRRD